MTMPNKIQQVLNTSTCVYTKNEVEAALDNMAIKISEHFQDKNPVILCVMVGGMVPMGNLLPRLNFPLEVDYVHASRYQGDTKGSELVWKAKPSISLKGRCVLIVDDILDGGVTLLSIIDYIKAEGADEVKTAVLVDKHSKRVENGLQKADYVGLTVEDRYIFGFGMDYNEYLRNIPGIHFVATEFE